MYFEFTIMIIGLASVSLSLLVAVVSRLQPASEFLQIPTRHIWTERIFKAEGWSRAVLLERSGDIARAMLNYITSACGKNVLTKSPQWAALSLFNAAVIAHKLNEKALQNRMLKLAAILYEQAFEPLLATFPEAAAWTATESGRCYMVIGDVDDAARMLQVAEQIHNRLSPLQQVRLNGEELAVLPDTISGKTTIHCDHDILKNVEKELQRLESAIGVR